jgi:DGQHR domain-containing protein
VDPENTVGYQRMPRESRFREGRGSIVGYLARELGCFPTSVLLNVRGKVVFEPNEDLGWCTLSELELGDDRLWVIDGQHRVEGLKRAIELNPDFEDYPVIVSILQQPERFDELLLFYIVNRRQVGVPTDLAYRHLQRMLWEKGEDWLLRIVGRRGVLASLLEETPTHPHVDFRGPLDLDFWSKEHGPMIAISTNMKAISELHDHISRKIQLTRRA